MNTSSSAISELNNDSKTIFDILWKLGPLTKNELLEITNMKLTTLNRFLKPLENLRLVEKSGIGESSGGRKPMLYDVNPYCCYTIGIDISRTYAQVVIVNLKMDIIFKERFTMDKTCSPTYTVELVSTIISKAMDKLNITLDEVLGIGIGVVGPIDQKRGIIRNPVNFPSEHWIDVPIKDMFLDKFNTTVFVDNGANTAVLAEYYFGSWEHMKNITYINCGIGIRTADITDGIIIRSINDTDDAFGHMVIDVDGHLCSCGNYGCIECYSSIASILECFISAVKKGRNTIVPKPIKDITYKDIIDAAEEGDILAKETIQDAAVILGKGLVNYINLLNPDMVILSGPLIINSQLFYNTCVDVASNKNYLKGNKNIYFHKGGRFGEDAISVGAAAMVGEILINR